MLNSPATKKSTKKKYRNPSREKDNRNNLESPKINLLGNITQYIVIQLISLLEIVRLG